MRLALRILLAFVAITAIPCGLLLVLRPDGSWLGLSTTLLQPTPFRSFLVPGLILSLLVGSANLQALVVHLRQGTNAFWHTLTAGVLIAGWIVVQIALIREFFWMQWLYLLAGFFIILISLQLKHKELI
ncbi:MAG TPA: hypothetical protein PKE63_10750 [Lacibacter sp.]|nr:hypothetical protein [Lacibacter sp.]HMO88220.1 hypothetical protein [Lacibacter sp.]HMP87748.1 hypothetical protein [Lacibacter sp.]